jgi:hypothetical protein
MFLMLTSSVYGSVCSRSGGSMDGSDGSGSVCSRSGGSMDGSDGSRSRRNSMQMLVGFQLEDLRKTVPLLLLWP